MVLSGAVSFEYDDQLQELKTGDCIYLDATVKHRLLNPNKKTAEVLCVLSDRNGAA